MSRQLTVYLAFVRPTRSPKKVRLFLHIHVMINLYVDNIPFKDQYHMTIFPYLNFLAGCLEVEIIIKLLGNGVPFKLLIL